MQELPHRYVVSAAARQSQDVQLDSPGLEPIVSAGPAEFGGPGNLWSPETLLVAAVADCYVLSFRAIARAARLDWLTLTCNVEATLDRVDGKTKFTEVVEKVELEIADAAQKSKASRLLEKAEKSCLITNSLTAEIHLDATVRVVA